MGRTGLVGWRSPRKTGGAGFPSRNRIGGGLMTLLMTLMVGVVDGNMSKLHTLTATIRRRKV